MKDIQLRRLNKGDAAQVANLANNKKVWDNLRDFIPYPYAEKDALLFIELTESESPQVTFGVLTEQGELCGVIGLVVQKGIYRLTAEIGYWLGEEYWGKGITTKAIELRLQKAISIYNIPRRFLTIELVKRYIFFPLLILILSVRILSACDCLIL